MQAAPCCFRCYCYLYYVTNATTHTIRRCFREAVCSQTGRGKKHGSSRYRMQRWKSVICSPCCGVAGRPEPLRSPIDLQNRQTSGSDAWYHHCGSSLFQRLSICEEMQQCALTAFHLTQLGLMGTSIFFCFCLFFGFLLFWFVLVFVFVCFFSSIYTCRIFTKNRSLRGRRRLQFKA